MKTKSIIAHNKTVLAFVAFNLVLLAFRMVVTSGIGYGFLVWNLFLSAVPLLISNYLVGKNASLKVLVLLSVVWLLFLTNAPYILTDFLHFRNLGKMPAWFDLLLLASFSICGLLFGLMSMARMQSVWEVGFGKKISDWLIPFSAILSGFGIYLGRYERYNTWDVLSDPLQILHDSVLLMTELRAIGFTLGYGTLTLLLYYFLKENARITSIR